VQDAHKDTIKMMRVAMERGWERFTPEERERAFAEALQVEKDDTAKLQASIVHAWYTERNAAITANLWGVGLIALGSVFQGLAIVFGP
jgi:hypothetical protein